VLPDKTPLPLAVHPRQMDRAFALDKPYHLRHPIFRRYGDQQVHVVAHHMPLPNPTLLLLRQMPEYLSQVLPQFHVQRLAAAFRDGVSGTYTWTIRLGFAVAS